MTYTTLERQSAYLDQRTAELGLQGDAYVALNSGSRRSPEKRALLRKLADLANENGSSPRFFANY
jgi:hypothetical protein